MGLLDDAIREHLELKRRHGAPDEEVKRQEHEALGPIRRRGDPEPQPAADTSVGAVPVDDDAAESLPEVEVATPGEASGIIAPPPAMPPAEQPVMPEPAGHEPVIEDFPEAEVPAAVPVETSHAGRAPSFIDDEPWLDDSPETPPSDLLEPPDEVSAAKRDTGADEAEGEPAPAEEDVLEETPDFLQETPEHDRLWFEQRPPRGFDFEQ